MCVEDGDEKVRHKKAGLGVGSPHWAAGRGNVRTQGSGEDDFLRKFSEVTLRRTI